MLHISSVVSCMFPVAYDILQIDAHMDFYA